jgi:membrane-bound lytic murein transglycosylase D
MKPKLILLLFALLPLLVTAQDSLTLKRLKEYPNPLKLTWDKSVKTAINDATITHNAKTEDALGKAAHFFPIFDSLFKKANLPTDLSYFALASSGMQFDYFDTLDGARGIWHFNYTQARLFDLKIRSYIDERLDPVLATHAFIRAIKEYYKIYQNWELAMAAFISSAPDLNKAIHYHGDTANYWVVQEDLNPNASVIVARTLAAALLHRNMTGYGLKAKTFTAPRSAGRIYISEWYSLDLLAAKSKIPSQTLAFLNPTYKRHIIPDLKDSFLIYLPAALMDSIAWVKSIRFSPYDAEYYDDDDGKAPIAIKVDTFEHIVKDGETLQSIATIYLVKVEEIQEWNTLDGEEVITNQRLIILREVKPPAPKPKPAPAFRTHTVRSGETLSGIAAKYKCTVNDIKKWNNLKSTVIRPGQKLKIK